MTLEKVTLKFRMTATVEVTVQAKPDDLLENAFLRACKIAKAELRSYKGDDMPFDKYEQQLTDGSWEDITDCY